jgi:plasmid stabilization system protein ParE
MPHITIEISDETNTFLLRQAAEKPSSPSELASEIVTKLLKNREEAISPLDKMQEDDRTGLRQLLMSRREGPFFELIDHRDLQKRVLAPYQPDSAPKPKCWIHREVEATDLNTIAAYYTAKDPATAEKLISSVTLAMDFTARSPLEGKHHDAIGSDLEDLRVKLIFMAREDFIFYEILPDNSGVRILHVRHMERDAVS